MITHEGKMWNMIGALGWVESGYDFNNTERLLFKQYSNADITMLSDFVDDCKTELCDIVERYETDNDMRFADWNGDADWNSAIANIVGMGKLTYDTIMNNPKRFADVHHVANFDYVLPWKHNISDRRKALN